MKKFTEMSQEEFKALTMQKALEDFEFFKETHGERAALEFMLDIVFEKAHNRGAFDERQVSK